MEDVGAKVAEVLLEILKITPEDIVPAAQFVDDLQATSIDLAEEVISLKQLSR
jgi:acyl carrier protein